MHLFNHGSASLRQWYRFVIREITLLTRSKQCCDWLLHLIDLTVTMPKGCKALVLLQHIWEGFDQCKSALSCKAWENAGSGCVIINML